ncbi:MAG: hypothetical protein ACE5GM_09995 [bacterium]
MGIHGYIVDVTTRERLEFQYNPDEINDSKSASYADIRIPGISHPRHQFIAGGARQIRFSLFWFKGEVKEKVAWLQSLLYPEHSGTALKSPPHRVIFIFGDLYEITCIVRQVKVRYKSIFSGDLIPQLAEVDIVLEETIA